MIELICGTNRPGSNTLKVVHVLEKIYGELGEKVGIIDLHELPAEIFNPSSYGEKPASFRPFQERVLAAKGLHVVTPEYNGSYPGVLKYFIDMLKFPESFEHRCVAYTGLGAGLWGCIRGVEQLQMVFGYRNGYSLPERVFLTQVNKRFGPDGQFTDEEMLGLLRIQAQKFIEFTGHFAKH